MAKFTLLAIFLILCTCHKFRGLPLNSVGIDDIGSIIEIFLASMLSMNKVTWPIKEYDSRICKQSVHVRATKSKIYKGQRNIAYIATMFNIILHARPTFKQFCQPLDI
jgi:hypothetical protein